MGKGGGNCHTREAVSLTGATGAAKSQSAKGPIGIGWVVRLRDNCGKMHFWRITSKANVEQHCLSQSSPLAQALKKGSSEVGTQVRVKTPKGMQEYQLVSAVKFIDS